MPVYIYFMSINLHGVRDLLETMMSTKQKWNKSKQDKPWFVQYLGYRSRLDRHYWWIEAMGSIRSQNIMGWGWEWTVWHLRSNSFKGKKNSEHHRRAVTLTVFGSWKKNESVTQFLTFSSEQPILSGLELLMNILVKFTSWKINKSLPGDAVYWPNILLTEYFWFVRGVYYK